MVDHTARRRVQVALLVGSAAAVAVILAVLFVSSVFGAANRDRGALRDRLANLEYEFRARTGQEPGPFESLTTTTTAPRSTSTTTARPPSNRPASTAPVTPPGRSPSTTGSQPSPPATAVPAPTQPPPPESSTTTACLAEVAGRCVTPVPPQLARSQHFRR